MSIRIYLANDLPGRHIIHYTLQLIASNQNAVFTYTTQTEDADISVDGTSFSGIGLCLSFYQYLTAYDIAAVKQLAKDSYHFYDTNGKEDLLASIFYLVNSLQEYHPDTIDQYGRFPYQDSLQHREGIMQVDVVQQLIDGFMVTHKVFSQIQSPPRKSGFFLTHDIDTVYGAKNQNGDYALKHHQYHRIPGLLWNHYLGKANWLNMDRIMKMEESFGFKSTFYWLVAKDSKNADYEIASQEIQKELSGIRAAGFEIGLHKSLSDSSFIEEKQKLDPTLIGQRYHFLRFNLPQAWSDIEAAGIKLDTSLGFSENFGFRNSYGLPFMPYDIRNKRVHDLIEVPMNVMDGNFFYQGKSVAQAEKELISWLDQNKENAIITINWHNNFFDDMLYAGYERLYDTLLRYFKEEKLNCMTQSSLIKEFYHPQYFSL